MRFGGIGGGFCFLWAMPVTTPATQAVADAYAACNAIAARDKPHLYDAAQHFTPQATRDAFAATYASMRVIDDFIDDIPDRSHISPETRKAAQQLVNRWLGQVQAAVEGRPDDGPIWIALADTFQKFHIPVHPWEDLAEAMITDLFVPRFRDWDHLHRYMKGASVAPAIVFMHLVLTKQVSEDRYQCAWDYQRVAKGTEDLAIFCYWVHILRDAARDLTLGETGLVYFPAADMERFGVSVDDLHALREAGHASDTYKSLAAFEAERAMGHLKRGEALVPAIVRDATPAHAKALTSLVATYAALLEQLRACQFDVFSSPVSLNSEQLSRIQD